MLKRRTLSISLVKNAGDVQLVTDAYYGGPALYEVSRKNYTEKDVAKQMKAMLQVVSYLHNTLDVVHRDLKPEHWLYDSQNSLKLIDFGLSYFASTSSKTVPRRPGTVAYLAPELVVLEINKFSEGMDGVSFDGAVKKSADMWAMGVILFRLLTGTIPFSSHGDSNVAVVRAILDYKENKTIKYGDDKFVSVSDNARKLIEGLLEKDPEKRLTAVQALQDPWIQDMTKQNSQFPSSNLFQSQGVSFLGLLTNRTPFMKATAEMMVLCLSAEDFSDLGETFLWFDRDYTGNLSFEEVQNALEYIKGASSKPDDFSDGDFSDGDLQLAFDGLDANKDNKLSFSEFVAATVWQKIAANAIDESIKKATFDRLGLFDRLDITKGFAEEISVASLQILFDRDDLEGMIAEADADKNNAINYREFDAFITTKGRELKETQEKTGELS